MYTEELFKTQHDINMIVQEQIKNLEMTNTIVMQIVQNQEKMIEELEAKCNELEQLIEGKES